LLTGSSIDVLQKDEIGTQSDSNELRKRIDTKKKEMQA